MKKIELANKTVEVTRVDDCPAVYDAGRNFRTADVNIIDDGKRFNNLCMHIHEDAQGDYLDFTKTRYKQFGKVKIH
ncbi:hypothetical protein MHB73_21330 [Bacillus sp. FSL K6-6483]